MKEPNPLALEMLAGNLPIYPKEYYEKAGPSGMATKPVGTGPYRLVEATPGTRYVFERFEDYYAGQPEGKGEDQAHDHAHPARANTQYAELINGGLDWIWRVPPDDARNLSRRPNVQDPNAEIMRFAYIALNPNIEGGKSPLARRPRAPRDQPCHQPRRRS